jgi:hypothetical protein
LELSLAVKILDLIFPVMAVLSVTSPTKRIAPGSTHYNLYIQRQGRHPEEKMFLGEAIIYPQLPIV